MSESEVLPQETKISPIDNNDDNFNCDDFKVKLFQNVPKPKLKIPNNRQIKNAWKAYEPSCETETLVTEIGRNIFAESYRSTLNDELFVEDLRILALQSLVQSYCQKDFDQQLSDNDKEYFGEHLDIELPVQNLIELNNDTYWRRVTEAKCKDKLLVLLKGNQMNDFINWKRLGISAKLTELIENTFVEDWDESNLVEIAKKIKSEVYELDIRQMKPLNDNSLEKSLYNESYKIYNYPPKNCHHGNLGQVITELHNLTSLKLKFGNEIELFSYQQRHFDISYKDIENLSNGLKNLKNLQAFTFHHSILDDRKLKILINALVNCPVLCELDLSYCHLTNDAGHSIGFFLSQNCTLQRLELRGNDIGPIGCQAIGYGLQQFKGSIEYIGLACNPINEQGVINIGSGFCHTETVRQLDFSQCDVDEIGAFRMAQIIGFHMPLTWMDLCSVPLGQNGGEKLIVNLMKHKNLLYLECRGCGLTENQEKEIKILLERNKFSRDNHPLLGKDLLTEADAEEIDQWISNVKHPILLKVLNKKPHRDSWNILEKASFSDLNTIPSFIPQDQRKICTNSEVLGFTVNEYQSDNNSLADPNKFNGEEIVEHILIGQSNDSSSTIYFQ